MLALGLLLFRKKTVKEHKFTVVGNPSKIEKASNVFEAFVFALMEL